MNLPNRLTLIRLILIPVMIFVFYLDLIFDNFNYAGLIAAAVFFVAAFTDFLDGHIARKYNLVTTIGKFLDPIADKVLVVTALFLVVEGGLIIAPVGAICASIIVARELVVSCLRQIGASKGVIIAADKTGKVKAVFQDIAMVMFLLYKTLLTLAGGTAVNVYLVSSYIILAVAVILTIWSGIEYLVKNKKVFFNI